MPRRVVPLTLIISALLLLAVVVPAAAGTHTYTETLQDQTLVFPDVTICDGVPVTVTLNYNSVLHVTEFSEDHPNAGSIHALWKVNFYVVANHAETGELLESARGVKTIFHDNVNRQNATARFSFVSVGSGPVGRHQFHLHGHVNWNAVENMFEFEKVTLHCW